jgi:hypothetical protein
MVRYHGAGNPPRLEAPFTNPLAGNSTIGDSGDIESAALKLRKVCGYRSDAAVPHMLPTFGGAFVQGDTN